MSLVMAMKGPVAIAGSISNFSSVSGTIVPNIEAKITIENRANETAVVISCEVPAIKLNAKTSTAIILALISETPSSFKICLPALRSYSEPFAKPCTTIADD